MMKRVTSVLFSCLMLLLALPAQAQEEVSVRQINEIPQENIDELEQLGSDATEEDLSRLIRSPYAFEQVQFTGVVLGEPQNSGLASVDDDDGMPGRVHFFVRDTSAASAGAHGQDIQIVDGSYQEHGVLGLFRGDVVTITGLVNYFADGYVVQIEPETVEAIGTVESLGLPASILDPVPVTTADLHVNAGGTSQRINWSNFVDYNQTFVRVEDATVWRSPNREDDRPDWAITTDGAETIVQNDDVSLCFRNDQNDYPDSFNTDCRDTDFTAPPPGAVVNVEGFALLRSDWDPFGIGNPAVAMLKLVPWEQEDVVVTEQPSITSVSFDDLTAVPGDAPIDLTLNIEGDVDAVADAQLIYQTSTMAEADTMGLSDQGSGVYTAQIPAQEDGTFVWYSAVVTDDQNTDFSTPAPATTRVLFDGINEIADVQETWTEIGSASPFAGQTVAMDITATVQTDPATSGFVAVQDDAELGAHSGILLTASEAVTADLEQGEVINITEGTVVENFDVTELDEVTYESQSTGETLGYKVVDSATLQDEAIAEAHEGMMVRFENHHILQPDAGFGEWSFSSDGSEDNEVFADDASDDISSSFNERFSQWEIIDFQQGLWWYSFGAYKLVPETASDVGEVTNVAVDDEEVPGTFALEQNYPNPFNPSTSITFSVPQSSQVRLELFDMLGRSVKVLVDEQRASGTYEVMIDGTGLSSGVYLYRLTAGEKTAVRKMLLMK